MRQKIKFDDGTILWQVGNLDIKIFANLQCSVALISKSNDKITMNSDLLDGKSFFSLVSGGKEADSWSVEYEDLKTVAIRSLFGKGFRLRLKAKDQRSFKSSVYLELDMEVYEDFPGTIHTRGVFDSDSELKVDALIMNQLNINAEIAGGDSTWDAWIYNGSGETREHHIQSLTPDYYKRNYLGLLESHDGGGYQPDYRCGSQPGYGGGIPLVDIWSRKLGLAIGHSDLSFRYVNLPVNVQGDQGIQLSMTYMPRDSIKPGRSLASYRGFVVLHEGDFYNSLSVYKQMMACQGMRFDKTVGGSYEPQWDTWGFNADFTMDDVRATLPYLKDIGIKWLTLDDRWFDVTGDWMPRKDTFPDGEKSLIDFIEELHNEGFKVRLWTIPGEFDGKPDLETWQAQHPTAAIEIAKHPFHAESKLFREHPEWMVAAPDGSLEYSKRGNYFAAGNLPQVQSYFRELTRKMFLEWKIDGYKQDAIYMAPQDYNPDHGLSSPEDAGDGYSQIMKVIYETAMECNPDAVIMNCPCGTPMTPQWMVWQNQAVTVDPWTSWVNRGVFKEMKGLFGPTAPVVLDHIEISDEGDDFSILGVGGVPATRFTPSGRDVTNEIEDRIFEVKPFEKKLELWKHWFHLYNSMRLSEGEYLNLYDIIYDKPETHVICKGEVLFYALYPGEPDGIEDDGGIEYREKKDTKHWKGSFTFRGLKHNTGYQVRDWEFDKDLGVINSNFPTMDFNIDHHLLLELTPVKGDK